MKSKIIVALSAFLIATSTGAAASDKGQSVTKSSPDKVVVATSCPWWFGGDRCVKHM
ncbi:hypothetical protein [Pseudoalteromonas sp. MMG022]|uniref:hypothetical protein n=1 Tax=Pseudoalteromonas sp. MMG022 TaxID=2909978 RepID=UPI001F33D645|nr:hypothetical protein [Pseudoalteromonas sp. MMG022]MCF6437822.1 hypothetical protein [Pseudoalteromonas sp. MMG022]